MIDDNKLALKSVYTCTCDCMHKHVYLHVCKYICMQVCVHAGVSACMCIYVYTWACVYMHTCICVYARENHIHLESFLKLSEQKGGSRDPHQTQHKEKSLTFL